MSGFDYGLSKAKLVDELSRQHEQTACALHDICRERVRQLREEGHTPAHDDAHDEGQLALAAAAEVCLAASDLVFAGPPSAEAWCPESLRDLAAELWPFERQAHSAKPARRHLVIAAALIVAEIERLDRAAERAGTPAT